MGIRLDIGGELYESESYNVSEDSTPTSSDDSTGSVGTFEFQLKDVQDSFLLEGKDVLLADSRRGSTIGFVKSVQEIDRTTVSVRCQSRLGRLNIYSVQAQPFVGTLGDAFRYYASLANQVTEVFIDPQIEFRPVIFPGWFGELWYHLKQMAAAQECEVSLVSNIILLRPLRVREATDNRDVERNRTYGDTRLARAVEVYRYNNAAITNELVYPPGRWTPETEVIAVGAGETISRVIELSSSVTSIVQPEMQTFVAPDYDATSVYTIVGDDGLPLTPAMWADYGGRLEVSINEDTTSLTVTITGPTGIVGGRGEAISTYSVALGADFTANRYSTLRIVGTGVAFDKKKMRIRTCVPDQLTGTDVGITIDNPFIDTIDDARRAGVRAARWFAGERMEINGVVTSINKLGDDGDATYPTYADDQDNWEGDTYSQVESAYSGQTYGEIEAAIREATHDDFDNQVFGNAGGARVWDWKSNHYFRIRTANIGTSTIEFSGEDDDTHEDHQNTYDNLTYAQEEAIFAGRTYSERDRLGLRV